MSRAALSFFFVIGLILQSAQAMEGLKIGDALPALALPNQDGKVLDLADYGKKGFLLIFFYPKANTPGCTAQACSLRDSIGELEKRGVRIVGISADKEDSQKEFVTRQSLPYPLLADKDSKVIAAFGVKGLFGFAQRSAFLFQNGKLVWRDSKGSTSDQGSTVLKALETLPRNP